VTADDTIMIKRSNTHSFINSLKTFTAKNVTSITRSSEHVIRTECNILAAIPPKRLPVTITFLTLNVSQQICYMHRNLWIRCKWCSCNFIC